LKIQKDDPIVKKWKMIVTILVLLVAVSTGTIYYFLNSKEDKTKDPKVAGIVKNDFKIQLPADKINQVSAGKQTGVNKTGTQAGESEAQTKNSGVSNGTTQSKTDSTASGVSNGTSQSKMRSTASGVQTVKPSAAAIIERYQPAFKNLESQADGKINTLLSYAFDEYQTKKANGEEISFFYFYSKYNSAAKKLEAGTDASFNYIYVSLVNDLEKAGYSASEAQPVKDQYTSMKKERRSALLNKAMSHF
jgi:hypothetical protein